MFQLSFVRNLITTVRNFFALRRPTFGVIRGIVPMSSRGNNILFVVKFNLLGFGCFVLLFHLSSPFLILLFIHRPECSIYHGERELLFVHTVPMVVFPVRRIDSHGLRNGYIQTCKHNLHILEPAASSVLPG